MVFILASLLLFSATSSTVFALPAASKPPKSTSSSGTTNTNTPTLDELLPISNPLESWTTLAGAPDALPLSDATLKPFDVMSGVNHTFTAAPDGTLAMQATYPKGSFNPSHKPRGGFSLYAPGPDQLDITTASEALFGYSVMFPAGFQFNKGGKLMGFYGGDDPKTAVGCSGGRRDPTCFSMRLMFRAKGAGELYTYLPDPSFGPQFAANKKMCDIANSTCNPTFGNSIARGAFSFTPGEWTTVSERVKLNTVGKSDGEIEIFVGGKSVINATDLVIRDSDKGRIRGMQMETFFGGATSDWASPVDQKAFFADFSMAILKKF
ncbi:polysaccharide lyase family 14 protein [Mycena amicta]|nr:polysaccharide lyase family 14 protein [Mycena amicta]